MAYDIDHFFSTAAINQEQNASILNFPIPFKLKHLAFDQTEIVHSYKISNNFSKQSSFLFKHKSACQYENFSP